MVRKYLKWILVLSFGILILGGIACVVPFSQDEGCLARNIYWESRLEPWAGQKLVAYVTVMRAAEPSAEYGGPSVCGVVYSRRVRTVGDHTITTADFSWTSIKGVADKPPENFWQYAQALLIARMMLQKPSAPDEFKDARFYMNRAKASPHSICWFGKNLVSVGTVGNHEFYRKATAAEKPGLASATPSECKSASVAAQTDELILPPPRPPRH